MSLGRSLPQVFDLILYPTSGVQEKRLQADMAPLNRLDAYETQEQAILERDNMQSLLGLSLVPQRNALNADRNCPKPSIALNTCFALSNPHCHRLPPACQMGKRKSKPCSHHHEPVFSVSRHVAPGLPPTIARPKRQVLSHIPPSQPSHAGGGA